MNRNFHEFMKPKPTQTFPNIANQIAPLIQELNNIQTQYQHERSYIGQAIAYLILLKDIIDNSPESHT